MSTINPREVMEAIDAERRHRRDLEDQIEQLKQTLRTVAVSIPVTWKDGRTQERRSYEAMSAFLIEDQRSRDRPRPRPRNRANRPVEPK